MDFQGVRYIHRNVLRVGRMLRWKMLMKAFQVSKEIWFAKSKSQSFPPQSPLLLEISRQLVFVPLAEDRSYCSS